MCSKAKVKICSNVEFTQTLCSARIVMKERNPYNNSWLPSNYGNQGILNSISENKKKEGFDGRAGNHFQF